MNSTLRLKYLARSKSTPFLLANLLFLALLLVSACGGGTRGSGGQLFDGVVTDNSLKTLPNVTVTIVDTGDTATTDSEGRFSIQTSNVSGSVDLLVEGGNFSNRVSTEPVPVEAERIFITITVGTGAKPPISTTIEIVQRHPTATAAPSKSTARPTTPIPSGPTPTTSTSNGSIVSEGSTSSTSTTSKSSDDNVSSSSEDHGDGSSENSASSDDSSNSSEDGRGSSSSQSSSSSSSRGPREGDGVDAQGAISALSGPVVTVQGIQFTVVNNSELLGQKGERVTLSAFSVGDSVRVKGRVRGGIAEVEKMEKR